MERVKRLRSDRNYSKKDTDEESDRFCEVKGLHPMKKAWEEDLPTRFKGKRKPRNFLPIRSLLLPHP